MYWGACRPPDTLLFFLRRAATQTPLLCFSGNAIRIGRGNTKNRKRQREHMNNLVIYAIRLGKRNKTKKQITLKVHPICGIFFFC